MVSYLSKRIVLHLPIYIIFFALLAPNYSSSQIRVYERPSQNLPENSGLFMNSPFRQKIDLNGNWDISFNEGSSYSSFIVPIAYDYEGEVIFKRSFSVSRETLDRYSFLFVAEGINYEANIRINNLFLANHKGGFSPIIVPIEEGILKDNNSIEISVDNVLSTTRSIPLANQINYSRNYGGIPRDIYIMAVPKIFVYDCRIICDLQGASARLQNIVTVKSSSLDNLYPGRDFMMYSKVINKNTGEEVVQSSPVSVSLENFKYGEFTNEFQIGSPELWSPEAPNLYIIQTIIEDSNGIIDQKITEFGIRDVKFKKDHVILNGRQIVLNGINYFEDSPDYASALEYAQVERDLRNIKELGVNCVRVPGRTAHPYIVNICNNIGLMLMVEIPFNEVPKKILAEEEYIRFAGEYLRDAIVRDRNAPCVIAWGVGNNFDVTKSISADYVKGAKETAGKYDNRPIYYTTRNMQRDVCEEYADLKGINFFTRSLTAIKSYTNDAVKPSRKGNPNLPLFVSRFGIDINNENRNGARDNNSVEAQAKFIVDAYEIIAKKYAGNFIVSYADWNAERPLNFRQNANPYLQTDGIFNLYREPKQAALYVKRVINNQDIPKILEGNAPDDSSYEFIIVGVIFTLALVFLISNVRKFKDYLWKCLVRPTNFFQFVSEQMLISVSLNIILSLMLSVGLALFFEGIFYYYRESNLFDMILASIFASDGIKLFFSEITNEPLYGILVFTILIFVIQIFISFLMYIFSFFTSGRNYYRNIYTVAVWSAVQMVIFLPIGTVIYKLGQENTEFIFLTVMLFSLLVVLYIIRLIKGARIIYNMSSFKAYLYGFVFSVIIFGGLYSYYYFVRNSFSIISLVQSYIS